MRKLQEKIDKVVDGTLLVIKLANKEELNIIIDDIKTVLNKFNTLISQACKDFSDHIIVDSVDLTTIYVVLPEEIQSIERLAHSIYIEIQLSADKKLPESYLKCSIGSIKFSKNNDLSADKLLSRLLYSMNSTNDPSYYCCYEENPIDIDKLKQGNINLNLLRASLVAKKARFMYQPIIDRKSNKVIYHECLLRIPDKDNNFISVGPMIQDAESKGLINIVDQTVIEMAVKELTEDKNISLSVNISNIGVVNKKLLRKIEELLNKYDVAKRLVIEITETSLNQNFLATEKFITTLHSYGCSIALDDFGSGFTSFKQLLNLPIDIIKIDGSYIRDILANDNNKFFVKALINLANNLGIKTVAEFVENGEIAEYLTEIEIDCMQGNYFLPASYEKV